MCQRVINSVLRTGHLAIIKQKNKGGKVLLELYPHIHLESFSFIRFVKCKSESGGRQVQEKVINHKKRVFMMSFRASYNRRIQKMRNLIVNRFLSKRVFTDTLLTCPHTKQAQCKIVQIKFIYPTHKSLKMSFSFQDSFIAQRLRIISTRPIFQQTVTHNNCNCSRKYKNY